MADAASDDDESSGEWEDDRSLARSIKGATYLWFVSVLPLHVPSPLSVFVCVPCPAETKSSTCAGFSDVHTATSLLKILPRVLAQRQYIQEHLPSIPEQGAGSVTRMRLPRRLAAAACSRRESASTIALHLGR